MGRDELRQEVLRKARDEAGAVRRQAEKEAAEIISQAEKNRKDAVKNAEHDARESVEREKRERLSTARLEAKLLLAEAREELIRAAEEELFKHFAAFKKKKAEYAHFLEKRIHEGVKELGNGAVVHVAEDDLELARKIVKDKKISASVSDKAAEVLGGALVVSKDGRIRCDCSFNAILEENREQFRKIAFKTLFGNK